MVSLVDSWRLMQVNPQVRWISRSILDRLTTYIVVLLAAFVGGLLGFWVQDRDPPSYQADFEIQTPVVPRGGQVLVREQIVRNRFCVTEINRMVIDGAGQRVTLDVVTLRPGFSHSETSVIPLGVPAFAIPGYALVRFTKSWRCNPLHSIWPIVAGPFDRTFTIVSGSEDSTLPWKGR